MLAVFQRNVRFSSNINFFINQNHRTADAGILVRSTVAVKRSAMKHMLQVLATYLKSVHA